MKIFIVHFNLGCCKNNSDGKMWVVAVNEEIAKIIAKQHTLMPITLVEEYDVENEIIFSTFHINSVYKLKSKTDNWGDWRIV